MISCNLRGSVVFWPFQRQPGVQTLHWHELGTGTSLLCCCFPVQQSCNAFLSRRSLKLWSAHAVISSLCTGCLSGWQGAPLLIWSVFNSSRSQCKMYQMSEVILQLSPPTWFETSFGQHSHLHGERQKATWQIYLFHDWNNEFTKQKLL